MCCANLPCARLPFRVDPKGLGAATMCQGPFAGVDSPFQLRPIFSRPQLADGRPPVENHSIEPPDRLGAGPRGIVGGWSHDAIGRDLGDAQKLFHFDRPRIVDSRCAD